MDSAVKASLLLSLLACASAQWPCPFEDKFCDPESSQTEIWTMSTSITSLSTVDEAAAECYAECNTPTDPLRDPPCEAFTVTKSGSRPPRCHLILEACVENIVDDCIDLGFCQSGPSDCAAPPVTCPVVAALTEGFVRWQCVDINYEPINPYVEQPPAGTICFQTCPSWKSADDSSARLTSECQDVAGVGEWSDVYNYDGAAMAYPPYADPATSYPKPDTADETLALTCGCPDLEVKWPYEDEAGVWYDPNTEEAAEFICNNPVVPGDLGEYLVQTDNTCVLYCDDHYVATAKCLNGAWSGNPEWGFWCYKVPGTV